MLTEAGIFGLGALSVGLGWLYDRHKRQRCWQEVEEVLADLNSGNLNRRLVVREAEACAEVCFGINTLAGHFQEEQKQRQTMERANKQLLTGLTHDVRTPLTSLRGYLEALDTETLSAEQRRADLATAQKKAWELQRYIEQLFQWFKLTNGEECCQLCWGDWAEATRRIAAQWIARWEAAHWHYELDLPEEAVMVRFDELAFQRMVDNILSNALIHSGGTQVRMRLWVEANEAVLAIADDGQGVKSEDVKAIFRRLYTGDEARRHGQGSGLGLAIVQELASLQGGRVWAESAPGEGLQVFIALPLRSQENQEERRLRQQI